MASKFPSSASLSAGPARNPWFHLLVLMLGPPRGPGCCALSFDASQDPPRTVVRVAPGVPAACPCQVRSSQSHPGGCSRMAPSHRHTRVNETVILPHNGHYYFFHTPLPFASTCPCLNRRVPTVVSSDSHLLSIGYSRASSIVSPTLTPVRPAQARRPYWLPVGLPALWYLVPSQRISEASATGVAVAQGVHPPARDPKQRQWCTTSLWGGLHCSWDTRTKSPYILARLAFISIDVGVPSGGRWARWSPRGLR